MKLYPMLTALLTLDFQRGVLELHPEASRCVPAAAQVVEYARENWTTVIHVGLGFSEGHPEIPKIGSAYQVIKQRNLFVTGSPSAQFLPELAHPHEVLVYKQRMGAFTANNLDLLLRSKGIEHLVLMGLTTSGAVLSTLRSAFDLDYHCVILSDACYDPNEDIHRFLIERVLPSQADILTTEDFISQQSEA